MDKKKKRPPTLSVKIKASVEKEDIETDEVKIKGLRVDTEVGDLKDSKFHPVEVEEK